MTLVQLEYLVSLDACRHFGEAAQQCSVTQPTLSMQLRKVEDMLGIRLFDRSKNKVKPTPLGEKVIAQAKEVLAAARKIHDILEEEQGDIKGPVSIGIIPTIAPSLIPLFAPELLKQFPKLELYFRELLTSDLTEALKKGTVDFGIMAEEHPHPDLKQILLYSEPFVVYTSARHPFFAKHIVEPSELTTKGLWLLFEGHCLRDQALKICGKSVENYSPFHYESGSLEGLKHLVDKQGGYTLLPELATLDFSHNERQKLRLFTEPAPAREVVLVTHRSFSRTKVTECLKASIHSSLPEKINTYKYPGPVDGTFK